MSKLVRGSSGGMPAWRRQLNQAQARSEKRRQEARPSRVLLLVDCSGSMEGNKLQQAREGAVNFADQALATGYRVGLICFGSDAKTQLAHTTTIEPLQQAVGRLSIIGSTNLAAAIKLGVKELGTEPGLKVLCIITDGYPDDPRTALSAAEEAKAQQIDIIAIGTDDANRAYLAQLATRDDLARKVERAVLRQGISEMALLLPKPR